MKRRGFSLLEVLLATTIFFMAVLAGLEFFGKAGKMFFRLKESEEEALAVCAALDKMKIDLIRAGQGLIPALCLGILEGVTADDTRLSVLSKEKEFKLTTDIPSGATVFTLGSVEGLMPGREVCILDAGKGEVHKVTTVDGKAVSISSPLAYKYIGDESSLFLIEKVAFFLDPKTRLLRRQVNSSPAQPLLEGVQEFEFFYEKEANLAGLTVRLISNVEKEHVLWVYPKNVGLGTFFKK